MQPNEVVNNTLNKIRALEEGHFGVEDIMDSIKQETMGENDIYKKQETQNRLSSLEEDSMIWAKHSQLHEKAYTISVPKKTRFRFIKRCINKLIRVFTRQQVEFNYYITELCSMIINKINNHTNLIYENYDALEKNNNKLKDSNDALHNIEIKLHQLENGYTLNMNQIDGMETEITGMQSDFTVKLEEMNRKLSAVNNQFMEAQSKLECLEKYGVFSEKHPTYDKQSSSQTGEDMILSFVFNLLNIPLSEVLYLDLGANHPKLISNTYFFYRLGARGVLVEANTALIPELKLFRSGDVILNKCISSKSGDLVEFYIIDSQWYGLSTSVKENVGNLQKINPEALERVVEIETISATDIMDQYFVGAPVLLSIDIEGKEEDILNSIDFNRHRPAVIVCEMIPFMTNTLMTVGHKNHEIIKIMNENDYVEFAFTGINSIFIDNQRL